MKNPETVITRHLLRWNRCLDRSTCLCIGVALLTLFVLSLPSTAAFAQTHDHEAPRGPERHDATLLTFACNAGNAGNAPLNRQLEEGPVPAGEVLENLMTRYNGDVAQPIRQLLVRFEEGRIVGHEVTREREMSPEETIATWDFGLERLSSLLPESETPITNESLQFVTAHVDAEMFWDAVREEEASRAMELLEMRGISTALVIAPIPSDKHLASENRFTMHPTVLMFESR